MEWQLGNNGNYVVRLARGERVMECLAEFCRDQQIEGAFLYGLGAVDEAELAHYSVENRKYSNIKFTQPLEVANMTGSVGTFEDDVLVHAHATLADESMKAMAGHVVEMRVSGTMELLVSPTGGLVKDMDAETGLKLFRLNQSLAHKA